MKSLILTLFSLCAFASFGSERMVFLVEDGQGKHVGESLNFKEARVLTSGDQWHLYPTLSSDGKTLAFVRGHDKSFELVVQSGDKTEVFDGDAYLLQPRFSNNGQVVFFSKEVDGVNRIVKLDLNQARANADFKGQVISQSEGYSPAPFASGERVVFQRNTDKGREIALLNLVTGEEKRLDEGMAPSLSKDERFVAYTKQVEGNWDVYIMDLSSEKALRATNHPGLDFSPGFDKSGNLVYTSDRLENGIFSIFFQSKKSWMGGLNQERVLLSKQGVSYYAPRLSGNMEIKLESKASMIGEPRSSFGAIEHRGKVYVAGGHMGAEHTYPPESFSDRLDVYDPATNKWTNLAPRPSKAHGYQLAAHGDYIYAFGGFAYEENNNPKWKSLGVVERYNIRKNEWEVVAHMPRNRSSNVVVQIEDKAYLIGGWDSTPKFDGDYDGTFHEQIDVFDFNTLSFSTLKAKLPKKRRAFSAFAKDGLIYMAGGISEGASHFDLLDEFIAFNPKTETFQRMPKLPFATFAPAAGAIDGKAYVFGGMFQLGDWEYVYVNHIYEYDFAKGEWNHTGRYLKEEKGFSQVVQLTSGQESSLGILGGHSYQENSDSPVSTFEVFSEEKSL